MGIGEIGRVIAIMRKHKNGRPVRQKNKMIGKGQSTDPTRKGLGHDLIIFLFGPLALIFVVRFTGFGIFYQGDPTDSERKRVVFLLASGAFFYLLIIIMLSLAVA